MYLLVDGRFTNRVVSKDFARHALHRTYSVRCQATRPPLSDVAAGRGRKRSYGEALPTPEQLRQDKSVPGIRSEYFAAGREHDFRIKSWPACGARSRSQTVAASGRHRASGLSATQELENSVPKPAYLITTDVTSDLSQILQNYVWRWGIEVNFREERNSLGVGQAQVRIPASTGNVPAMIVASYAMLLLCWL